MAFVVGPILAGAGRGEGGSVWAIGIDALSFAVSAAASPRSGSSRRRSTRPRDLFDGVRFLRRPAAPRGYVVFVALSVLSSGTMAAGILDVLISTCDTCSAPETAPSGSRSGWERSAPSWARSRRPRSGRGRVRAVLRRVDGRAGGRARVHGGRWRRRERRAPGVRGGELDRRHGHAQRGDADAPAGGDPAGAARRVTAAFWTWRPSSRRGRGARHCRSPTGGGRRSRSAAPGSACWPSRSSPRCSCCRRHATPTPRTLRRSTERVSRSQALRDAPLIIPRRRAATGAAEEEERQLVHAAGTTTGPYPSASSDLGDGARIKDAGGWRPPAPAAVGKLGVRIAPAHDVTTSTVDGSSPRGSSRARFERLLAAYGASPGAPWNPATDDIDEPPPLARAHRGDHRVDEPEGADDVHVDDPQRVAERAIEQLAGERRRRVVDGDPDGAPDRGLDEPLRERRVGEVGDDGVTVTGWAFRSAAASSSRTSARRARSTRSSPRAASAVSNT